VYSRATTGFTQPDSIPFKITSAVSWVSSCIQQPQQRIKHFLTTSACETWGCHTKQSVRRVPTFHSRFCWDVDTGPTNYTVLHPMRL
jgi:hypothetical protein